MPIPIYSSMPRVLRWSFIGLITLGTCIFWFSWYIAKPDHQEYWTAFFLHVLAELWSFAFGIIATFTIAHQLAGHKIQPLISLIAKLREEGVINKKTARGVVICAARIFSEEVLTKPTNLSITPKPINCHVCALELDKPIDERCPHCGLHEKFWQINFEAKEVPEPQTSV